MARPVWMPTCSCGISGSWRDPSTMARAKAAAPAGRRNASISPSDLFDELAVVIQSYGTDSCLEPGQDLHRGPIALSLRQLGEGRQVDKHDRGLDGALLASGVGRKVQIRTLDLRLEQ